MRKISLAFLLILICSPLYAWNSESGSGIVSTNANISRASLEATQILQSDVLTNLYGVTILGGTSNYASFDSGGVLNFQNVVSSRDVILLANDQYITWKNTSGVNLKMGLTPANTFLLPGDISVTSASSNTLNISNVFNSSGDASFVKISSDSIHVKTGGILRVSGNTNLSNVSANSLMATNNVSVSGNLTAIGVTSLGNTLITGFSKFGSNGNESWLTNSGVSTYLGTARPRRSIYLSGGGATVNTASQSSDTTGIGGISSLFKHTRLVFSPFAVQDAYWNFIVPDSFIGTSVNTSIVWYIKSTETTAVASFDVQTASLTDSASYDTATYGAYGSVTDTGDVSGDVLKTASFSVPVSWVSGSMAYIRLQKNSTDAADTVSHNANVLGMIMEYEAQTNSD